MPEWVRQREKETLAPWRTKQYAKWCAMPLPAKRLMQFVIKRYTKEKALDYARKEGGKYLKTIKEDQQ